MRKVSILKSLLFLLIIFLSGCDNRVSSVSGGNVLAYIAEYIDEKTGLDTKVNIRALREVASKLLGIDKGSESSELSVDAASTLYGLVLSAANVRILPSNASETSTVTKIKTMEIDSITNAYEDEVVAYVVEPLPSGISITNTSLKTYIVSIYDNTYGLDIEGSIDDNTNKIIIKIPYTVTSGNITLPAYSQNRTLDANISKNGLRSAVIVTFAYPAQNNLHGSGTFDASITVNTKNSPFNLKQYDFQSGVKSQLIASFTYSVNDNNDIGVYEVVIINGILDKMFDTSDNTGTIAHNFIYLPIVSPNTGKTWLNNNLGAEYADMTNKNGNFNPAQQSKDTADYKAYGSLFQWGRAADGHELMTRTAASIEGTTVVTANTSPTQKDIPTNAFFITTSSYPNDWRESPDIALWNSESSTNNPCPVGFRVPTQTELIAERDGAINPITNYTTAQDNFLKLTPAGSRFFTNGRIHYGGDHGHYWTASVNTTFSKYLEIYPSGSVLSIYYRAIAYSIRCIKN